VNINFEIRFIISALALAIYGNKANHSAQGDVRHGGPSDAAALS
jgi:hypothetical protein